MDEHEGGGLEPRWGGVDALHSKDGLQGQSLNFYCKVLVCNFVSIMIILISTNFRQNILIRKLIVWGVFLWRRHSLIEIIVWLSVCTKYILENRGLNMLPFEIDDINYS